VNKLLLLGAGESGKSTLFKQMIKIYGVGFSDYERKTTYVKVVHANAIANIKTLIAHVQPFGQIEEKNIPLAKMIEEMKNDSELTPAAGNVISQLWADQGIQAAYAQRNHFQLNDSCAYFLNKIHEISAENYIPSDADILGVRVRTTGIVSNEFVINENKFQMFDVGGQRNERKKWIHCFENVTAVIFVTALSEYDQVLYEDESVNRLKESLTLFDEICNSRWFRTTSMILFLNKRDLFATKLELRPITIACPEYTGPQEYEPCVTHITNAFLARNRVLDHNNVAKKIYTHITCATDTDNVTAVFDAVKDIIIRNSLAAAGLV
jgi:GTPase SAR1 family protein